ncbi:hypothetical protein R6Y94_42070 [Plantactinospora sp. KLBMP9567]|nr:hypothetical protein [Plantactinospora sp. KLBMP9567]MDW5330357.1 hypothetical protein [Plantactinospora sp. KLBMP9567]
MRSRTGGHTASAGPRGAHGRIARRERKRAVDDAGRRRPRKRTEVSMAKKSRKKKARKKSAANHGKRPNS